MAQKRLPDDFRDFLNSLNKNNVKYLLLGGWAVGMLIPAFFRHVNPTIFYNG
jgi:hypothetical protein